MRGGNRNRIVTPRQLYTGHSRRCESGPVRIDKDWTGTFIRGDDSISYANALSSILLNGADPELMPVLRELRDLLSQSEELR